MNMEGYSFKESGWFTFIDFGLVWIGLRAHNTVTLFYCCTAFSILDYFYQEFCLLYSNASLFGHFTCFFFIAIIIFFFNSLTFDFVWLKMIEERKTKVNKQAHKQTNEWMNKRTLLIYNLERKKTSSYFYTTFQNL